MTWPIDDACITRALNVCIGFVCGIFLTNCVIVLPFKSIPWESVLFEVHSCWNACSLMCRIGSWTHYASPIDDACITRCIECVYWFCIIVAFPDQLCDSILYLNQIHQESVREEFTTAGRKRMFVDVSKTKLDALHDFMAY
jgi:hypothetical protein